MTLWNIAETAGIIYLLIGVLLLAYVVRTTGAPRMGRSGTPFIYFIIISALLWPFVVVVTYQREQRKKTIQHKETGK